ncbi:MAG: F0F1 ATP synthase subunit epsilon [Pseudomonadota bacterium]|nr:F0F1 ATP synthase subunit epsilon [Pseudomonadota bacterium]MEC8793588.1 F0F1 ATP synthase subunit epsilon [Pseudomonadota bacterium]
MAETTAFELVSPERLLVSKDVEMVVVPGAEGYFGVLPRHAPMISTLNAGVIDIHQGGQVGERIFIAGGFAEVTEGRCTVLAEEAVPVGEIDPAAVNQEIANLSDELKDSAGGPETARLSQRIQMLEAKAAAAA